MTTGMKRRKIERPRAPGAPYSVEQVASELNLAPRTVRKRIAEGKLRAYRDGRSVRVTEGDLAEYKAALMPGSAPSAGSPIPLRRHLVTRRRP
jgi:excisionase family DNA binding protein